MARMKDEDPVYGSKRITTGDPTSRLQSKQAGARCPQSLGSRGRQGREGDQRS